KKQESWPPTSWPRKTSTRPLPIAPSGVPTSAAGSAKVSCLSPAGGRRRETDHEDHQAGSRRLPLTQVANVVPRRLERAHRTERQRQVKPAARAGDAEHGRSGGARSAHSEGRWNGTYRVGRTGGSNPHPGQDDTHSAVRRQRARRPDL